MTVRDNLAFPLINRGLGREEVDARVLAIARLLELESVLSRRASRLSADGKQKVSLGRGLVRSDVNVIMFDEPLTVIDPHLKLALRSKLKELHQRTGRTMIYVTHDQTEALTFAQRVVVMYAGKIVQVGTPIELFDKPQHTFVGHFIGSPGMNVLGVQLDGDRVSIDGVPLPLELPSGSRLAGKRLEIGVRPEFVRLAESGILVRIVRVSDAGRYQVAEARLGDERIHLLAGEGVAVPGPDQNARIQLDEARTRLYVDGWLVE
jgi:glycerol transport system ATP-binding protein